MTIEVYFSFVFAVVVFMLLPGPIVTLIVATSAADGARRGVMVAVGAATGTLIQLTIISMGLAAVIEAAAQIFVWFKWIGAAYLIYLGVQIIRTRNQGAGIVAPSSHKWTFFRGLLVALSNPKSLIFLTAFLPQFINMAAPVGPQLLLLSVTMLVLGLSLDSSYAILTGKARGWLSDRRRQGPVKWLAGTMLIGGGLWLALARR